MNNLKTKIRNVIRAWRNVSESVEPSEAESAMEDALLDLESVLLEKQQHVTFVQDVERR